MVCLTALGLGPDTPRAQVYLRPPVICSSTSLTRLPINNVTTKLKATKYRAQRTFPGQESPSLSMVSMPLYPHTRHLPMTADDILPRPARLEDSGADAVAWLARKHLVEVPALVRETGWWLAAEHALQCLFECYAAAGRDLGCERHSGWWSSMARSRSSKACCHAWEK